MAIIALQSAASGLNALNTKLDVIANNLANVNTEGYKASRANFQDLLYIERAQPGVENPNGDERPTGLYVGLGVKVSGTQQEFSQGAPISTGQELDLMIEGRGFFQVQVEPELGGGTAYTRAGNFVLNSDGDIVLANDQGRRLEPNINIPQEAVKVDVSTDGQVWYIVAGETEPQVAGQIELASFINPAGLRQVGENLWVESAASGNPVVGVPGENSTGRVRQGMLEASNVDPARELIELIRTQRAYEMNSQSIRAADQALQTIAQLRR
ncbi:MAG: flagellar basal-body rod protein FlgG [Phycisphaeraceae bacterium]|nr:flagellar basal-body rod protein FlgG [Phycisphaeraceae bacterium]MCW5762495.1 flagellar basal-body rod protein FlgG [Phycisphaeraceae bacterium]